MVRSYVRKTDRSSYPKEKLEEAVQLVKNGELSGYSASLQYGIPRSTIMARVNEVKGLKSSTLGRNTVLSKEVEESLATNLHLMEKHGFGLTRIEILELVGEYITQNGIPNPFKDNVPGDDWLMGFRKRHNLSIKKPQGVEQARKNSCNPFVIYQYFKLLKDTLDELDLHDKPEQIWNVDETSFSKDPCKTKIVGLKGFPATRTISSPGKDNTTVLLGCSASGQKTPPLVVYKGKHIWSKWVSENDYPGTVYAATTNGWMETSVFEAFFDKVFLPIIGERRPVLLIYDGHSTHVGINIVEKARNANVTVLKLPPHTSHLLQPLDLAVNKSVKDRWDRALVKWQRLNVGKVLPKKEFSRLIGEIWSSIEPSICAAGFRKGGIAPFNENVIPEEKFNATQLRAWKNRTSSNSDQTQMQCTTDQSRALVEREPLPQPTQNVQNPPSLHHLVFQTIARNLQFQEPDQSIPDLPQSTQQIQNFGPSTNQCSFELLINEPKQHQHVCAKSFMVTEGQSKVVSTLHDVSSMTSGQNKVIITDNILVKSNITFEELLLNTIKPGESIKTQRKRIAPGAEVITHEEVFKRLKTTEDEKLHKTKEFKMREKTKKKKLTKKIKKEQENVEKESLNGLDETDNVRDKECAKLIKPGTSSSLHDRRITAIEKQIKPKKMPKNKDKNIKKGMKKKQKKEVSSSSDSDENAYYNDESDQDYNDYCHDILTQADRDFKDNFETDIKEKNAEADSENKTLEDDGDGNINKFEKEKGRSSRLHGRRITAMGKENKPKNMPKNKEKNIKKGLKKKQIKEVSSSSDNDENAYCDDESDQDYNDYCQDILTQADRDLKDYFETDIKEKNAEADSENKTLEDDGDGNITKFEKGEWLLVKFETKKTVKHFVGTVLNVNELRQPTVKFTRKYISKEAGSTFIFPQVEDVMEILHVEDVICKLPNPRICRRGQIVFKLAFDHYNIC